MKSLIVGGSNTSTFQIPDNSIRFLNPAGSLANLSIEASAELPCREAGTMSNMQMYLPSNTASVTTVVTLRKSGANTAVTFSVGPDLAGLFEDNVNTEAYANTDTFCIEVNVPTEAGSNFFNVHTIALVFTPDNTNNTISWMCAEGPATLSAASSTVFIPPAGKFGTTGAEGNTKLRIRRAFTASGLHAYVSSNARLTDTIIRTRINAGNGNQLVTYTSTLAGYLEDNSNTDTLSIGDDFNYSITTGTGTENFVLVQAGCQLLSTEGFFQMAWGSGNGTAQANNITRYYGLNNGAGGLNATETNVRVLPHFNMELTDLTCLVTANSFTTLACNVFVRDGSSDGNNTVSFAAGVTGVAVDTTNTDTISSGVDYICYRIITPNQAGSLTIRSIGVIGKETSAPPPSDTPMRMLMGVGQ